jgi:hypothetical protein
MRQAKVCKWCLELTWTFWGHTLGNWGDRKFWLCPECSEHGSNGSPVIDAAKIGPTVG